MCIIVFATARSGTLPASYPIVTMGSLYEGEVTGA
jgi:hypothetical protein